MNNGKNEFWEKEKRELLGKMIEKVTALSQSALPPPQEAQALRENVS